MKMITKLSFTELEIQKILSLTKIRNSGICHIICQFFTFTHLSTYIQRNLIKFN